MSEIPAVMLCIDKGNYEIAKVFINNNCSGKIAVSGRLISLFFF